MIRRRAVALISLTLTFCLLFGACSSKVRFKHYKSRYELPDEVPSSYSMLDDGYVPDVENQVAGTCWVSAATTVMENSYRMYSGRDVEMDALALACMVYNPHSVEGYTLSNRADVYDFGGSSEMIANTSSNGFGSYVLVDSCDLTNCSENDIKRAVMTFGGVTAALTDEEENYYFTGDTCTMIGGENDPLSHAGVIVGWDDDFPKEDFVREASRDGAWLVQNSYSNTWGDGGFYWVSYDTPLRDIRSMVMSIEYSTVCNYESGYTAYLSYGDSVSVANVFHRTGRLMAVGTYTTRENQHLEITIYDEDMKEVLDAYEVTFEYPGYHTVRLDDPLSVEGVAIAITYSGEAPMEGESWDEDGLYYHASISEGQSYVLCDGEWRDLSDADTLTEIGLSSSSNNCCIKALYA